MRRHCCSFWACVLMREIYAYPRTGVTDGSPARSPFLSRGPFMVNIIPFLLPNAVIFFPCVTGTSQSSSRVLIYHSEFVAPQLGSRIFSSLSKATYRTSRLDYKFSSVWDRINTVREVSPEVMAQTGPHYNVRRHPVSLESDHQ